MLGELWRSVVGFHPLAGNSTIVLPRPSIASEVALIATAYLGMLAILIVGLRQETAVSSRGGGGSESTCSRRSPPGCCSSRSIDRSFTTISQILAAAADSGAVVVGRAFTQVPGLCRELKRRYGTPELVGGIRIYVGDPVPI